MPTITTDAANDTATAELDPCSARGDATLSPSGWVPRPCPHTATVSWWVTWEASSETAQTHLSLTRKWPIAHASIARCCRPQAEVGAIAGQEP